MPPELDAAAGVATFIILGILGGSAFLWICFIQRPRLEIAPDAEVIPWRISWVDFLLFITAQIIIVTSVQLIGASVLRDSFEAADRQLTPPLAIAAVLMLQIPLLAVYYAARRFFPVEFASRLNTQSYSFGAAFREAAPQFIMFLPIIWIVTFVWTQALSILQSVGLIEEFPPQELIQLFQEGGNPIAISILVLFAVVLAPLVEEIIFRGCIYRFLKNQTKPITAQLLSGAIFALMHGNLMSFVPLVLVGILLARVYEKSGNLLVPICFHAFFNGFSLLMLFIMSQSAILSP